MRDFPGADRAAAAGVTIFDHDALPKRGAHLVRDRPGHNIVGATGRQRN